METIHKKNGRLHIYVRQDKYKGELKSHNWVGRTYINGKQKIISSGTSNLEEATPILEKWYDELQVSSTQKDPLPTENRATQTEKPSPEVVKENISQYFNTIQKMTNPYDNNDGVGGGAGSVLIEINSDGSKFILSVEIFILSFFSKL